MKYALFLALISLGINQTLVVAAIPTLMAWSEQTPNSPSLGVLVLAVNLNLVSYWFGASRWGYVAKKLGVSRTLHIAALGFISANLLFFATFYSESPHVWQIGICRILVGAFSCAFLPMAQMLLAAKNDATSAALSRLSSALTLGRLIGPSLLFLPVSFEYLLLIPVVMILPVLCSRFDIEFVQTPLGTEQELVTIRDRQYFIYASAIMTTAIVAVFQFYALEFLNLKGYRAEQGSDMYASLMLATSVLLIFYQVRVIPLLSQRRPELFLPILLFALMCGSTTLLAFGEFWWGLGLSLLGLIFAISGLPAWYTARLLASEENTVKQAKLSGYLTRAHTTGHIIGTGGASLFLHQQWTLTFLIAAFSIALLFCASRLHLLTNDPEQIKTY
ncbi:MFS transporter [Shewanella woodyi]|uniref:MFS transporter n=1 Tax=Shewanella woodyi TaxID=60961 RepID=UPI00374862DF